MGEEKDYKNLSRSEIIKKLQKEFEESETLQWYIELEILRLSSKKDLTYDELKELANFSEKQLNKVDEKDN